MSMEITCTICGATQWVSVLEDDPSTNAVTWSDPDPDKWIGGNPKCNHHEEAIEGTGNYED